MAALRSMLLTLALSPLIMRDQVLGQQAMFGDNVCNLMSFAEALYNKCDRSPGRRATAGELRQRASADDRVHAEHDQRAE